MGSPRGCGCPLDSLGAVDCLSAALLPVDGPPGSLWAVNSPSADMEAVDGSYGGVGAVNGPFAILCG